MVEHSFETWWRAHFGEHLPLGHELRRALPDRWLRIHTLPDSKRYADSEPEHEEILDRQLAAAREVLGEDDAPYVAVPIYREECTPWTGIPAEVYRDAPPLALLLTFPGTEFRRSIEFDEDDGGGGAIYAARVDLAETALRAIADDELRAVWASATTGEVFAPYDGGVDLIVRTPERVAELQARFGDWLSPRADGL